MIQNLNLESIECIFCVEGPEKGKLYNYNHHCGNYKIHQKCFHEWIIKEGNSCIICRKDAFENEETISFLNSLLIETLRSTIRSINTLPNIDTIPSIKYTEMEKEDIIDNQPNFGINIEIIDNLNLNMERLSENIALNIINQNREVNNRSFCYYFGFFFILLIGVIFLFFG